MSVAWDPRPPPPPDDGERQKQLVSLLFSQVDLDHDGRITRAEFVAWLRGAAVSTRARTHARMAPRSIRPGSCFVCPVSVSADASGARLWCPCALLTDMAAG
jgi:hypothetical protein